MKENDIIEINGVQRRIVKMLDKRGIYKTCSLTNPRDVGLLLAKGV